MRDDEDRADHGHEEGDDATRAFEAMRGELALLRRAVEGLAAERANIDVPDYSETLGHLQQGVNTAAENIARIGQFLKQAPALAMTPEQMASRIAAAAGPARDEDRRTIASAKQGLESATNELQRYIVSARRGDEQNRWITRTAIAGVLAGMALWAAIGGALLRATPDSWGWPEGMAARVLGGSEWEGARRLAAASNPGGWNAMVAGVVIGRGNTQALERCQRSANKAGEPVRCAVRIRPEER